MRGGDEGREGTSCIQTVSRRGYRFLPAVTWSTDGDTVPLSMVQAHQAPSVAPPRRWSRQRLVAAAAMALIIAIVFAGLLKQFTQGAPPPLAVAVLPFATDASSTLIDPADRFAEDLKMDLSKMWLFPVSADQATLRFWDQAFDAKAAGRALGVRYLVEGSVRASGDSLLVHAALVSAETGAVLWRTMSFSRRPTWLRMRRMPPNGCRVPSPPI